MDDPKLRRRYVYMNDDEWAWLKDRAGGAGVTMSQIVRDAVLWARWNFADKPGTPPPATATARPAPTHALHDTPARGVIASPADFHGSPYAAKPVAKPPGVPTNKAFTEFRPAPKPTSRKKR